MADPRHHPTLTEISRNTVQSSLDRGSATPHSRAKARTRLATYTACANPSDGSAR